MFDLPPHIAGDLSTDPEIENSSTFRIDNLTPNLAVLKFLLLFIFQGRDCVPVFSVVSPEVAGPVGLLGVQGFDERERQLLRQCRDGELEPQL